MDTNDLVVLNKRIKFVSELEKGDRIDVMGYHCTVKSTDINVYNDILVTFEFHPELEIKDSSICLPADLLIPLVTQ